MGVNPKKKRNFDYFTSYIAIILATLSIGCVASPAGPPAPLAEIPASLSFPDASINLDTISSGSDATLKMQRHAFPVKTFVGPDGEFSKVIAQGPRDIAAILDVLSSTLQLINADTIPVSSTLSQLEFNNSPNRQSGQIIKFDFTPFDFDGDGAAEACTGCTCPTGCSPNLAVCPREAPLAELKPVCFRIWFQRDPGSPMERLMAGVFDLLPLPDDPNTGNDEGNPGKGTYILGGGGRATFRDQPSIGSSFVSLAFDHRMPNEVFNLITEMTFVSKQVDLSGNLLNRSATSSLVDQKPVDDSGDPLRVRKTVKTTFEGFEVPESGSETPFNSENKYIGRFREDLDFWSGSFINTEASINIPTTCARISTGNGALEELCLDAGIDTSNEAFLPPANDLNFPLDFPLVPPF